MTMRAWMLCLAATGSACVAPRSVVQSGRVTPAGELRLGGEMTVNVGTASASELGDGIQTTVDELAERDDNSFDSSVNAGTKAAVAYALDPAFGMGTAFSLRYGILERLDAGYKNASGAHVLDVRFQFLGSPGKRASDADFGTGDDALAASIGLQYSRQSYELPSLLGLDKLASLFGFHMTRQDLLVPVSLSLPFGADEKFGAFSFGGVAGYTFLAYGLDPNGLVKEVDGVEETVEAVSAEQGFATFGAFAHVKVGYRFAYIGAGLAAYYQDYGEFEILDQQTFELRGVTIVPTINAEIHY